MAELKEGMISGAMNLYFIYKFLRILTTPWEKTDAFKLGVIDENGKILKKKGKLKTTEEKESYTMMHRLVWKLKRLMEKVPFGKTRLASYAAALWLIKEEKIFYGTDEELQESFLTFLETDWKNDALVLKENYEGDMDKKTYSKFLSEAETFAINAIKGKKVVGNIWGVLKREIDDAVKMMQVEYPKSTISVENKSGKIIKTYKEEVEIEEALKPADKKVLDAFYNKEKASGKLLDTDGKSLDKMGMGGQQIAVWKGNKVKITAVSDVKSTEEILRALKKSIPSGLFEEVEVEESMKLQATMALDDAGVKAN